jgi:hypothetical protein
LISLAAVGIGTWVKSPSFLRFGACWEDDGVGLAAAEDEAQVGRMAQRPLPLDDDHVGVLALEGLHHGGLHLARAELAGDRVEGDAIAGSLDETGLTGADHDGRDPALVE